MTKLKQLFLKILDKPLYFWGIVAVTFILARVATWGYPFDSDHWIFYYVGKIWAHGGTLYLDAWDHKPPLIFLFNGLMSLVFGGNIIWHRIWLTLLSVVDIALFWQLAKRVMPKLLSFRHSELSEESSISSLSESIDSASQRPGPFVPLRVTTRADLAAKVALLLYVFWRNLSQFTSSGNNTENYGLIFFLGMWLSYLSFRKDQKWWKFLISGACFSCLFFLKGNFLLLGVPIGILLLVDNWKSIRKFFGYGIIFVIPLFAQLGWWLYYFNSKGALNDFFIASFQFSAKYSGSAWSGDVSSNIVLLLTTLIFLLPALLFFVVYLLDAKKNIKNHDYLLIGLTFLMGLGLTIGVGSFYPYYFLIFMPVSVLILTYGLFRIQTLNKYLKILFYLGLAGSMLLSYGISLKQLYNSIGGSVVVEAQEYREVAAYVNENTEVTDKVFAYDYGATFYQLSNRDSGSRFISASVLLLENRDNYGFGFDDIFIADMEKSQPEYIVVYTDRDSLYYDNKPIVEYLDEHYVLDKTFTKFSVLKRK